MRLTSILGAVAIAGLGTAIVIPQFTRADRQEKANSWCLSQYNAAVDFGTKLPPIDKATVVHQTLYGGREESCSANNGAVTWNPSNNSLTLFQK